MDSERLDIRSSLKALAADARRDLSAHLEPEQLLAYRAGELSPEAIDPLRDHLALCPECAQLLLDLDEFASEPPSSAAPISDRDLESAWKDVRRELVVEGRLESRPRSLGSTAAPGIVPALSPLPFERPVARPSRRLVYGLAASLVTFMAISGWEGMLLVGHLKPDVSKPAEQGERVQMAWVPASSELRVLRSGEDPQDIHSGKAPFFLVSLRIPDSVSSSYQIEFSREGQGGRPLSTLPGLRRGDELAQLVIFRQGLTPGLYQLRIFPEGQQDVAAEFKIRLTAQ